MCYHFRMGLDLDLQPEQIKTRSIDKISPKISSVNKIFKTILNPKKDNFDSLKSIRKLKNSAGENRYPFLFNGVLQIVNILNRDLNKAFKKIDKKSIDDEFHGSINFSKLKLRHASNSFSNKRYITKLDRQLAMYVSNKIPLTKKLYNRLLVLEASGDVVIENLKTHEDISNALVGNKDKIQISKLDLNIVKKIQDKEKLSEGNQKRADSLKRDGYLDPSLNATKKFQSTKQNMMQMGILDDREYKTVTHKEMIHHSIKADKKLQQSLIKDERETKKVAVEGRQLSRKLNDDQINILRELKLFSNMSESQLFSIYQDNNTEDFFKKDIDKLIKNGVLKKEEKQFRDMKFPLYHLSYTGNKLASEVELQKTATFSKNYSKDNREILHDLLQYESYRLVQKNMKDEIGKMVSVSTDREKRSEMYRAMIQKKKEEGGSYTNFSDIKEINREDYGDLSIEYLDKNGNLKEINIEIDRGYDIGVIQKKSAAIPNMVWVTDSSGQAEKIKANAKSGYKAIWEVQ